MYTSVNFLFIYACHYNYFDKTLLYMHYSTMHMHSGFPTGRFEQTIMTSLYDVTRISHAVKGENHKRRALPNLGAAVTVIWVFGYKAFGFISKPQTLYLGCLGASCGGSITRMDSVTYLSICMHPDLS